MLRAGRVRRRNGRRGEASAIVRRAGSRWRPAGGRYCRPGPPIRACLRLPRRERRSQAGRGGEVGVEGEGDTVDGGEAGVGLAEFDAGEHAPAELGGVGELLDAPTALFAQRADAPADTGDELLRCLTVGVLSLLMVSTIVRKKLPPDRVGNILLIMRVISSPRVSEQAVLAALRDAFGAPSSVRHRLRASSSSTCPVAVTSSTTRPSCPMPTSTRSRSPRTCPTLPLPPWSRRGRCS